MLRHRTIESQMSRQGELGTDGYIGLWDLVATQIILLVGEAGFESLYVRSVFLSQVQFPWLTVDIPMGPADHRFANLKASFKAQSLAVTEEANRVLMLKLTDILASLIGEPLTASILESAWGSDTKQIPKGVSN